MDGFGAGADDYLTKPFAFEELLVRTKALLRRTTYQEPLQILQVADLTMDRETREVRRGTTVLSLTAKEYHLLEYLMTHAGKPMSRTMIVEQVWGYNYDPMTNSLDVYISALRKKIDAGASQKLIQTVRDVGYKIPE